MNAALLLLAGLVLEDGRRWIEAATDWQIADATAILDQRTFINVFALQLQPDAIVLILDQAALPVFQTSSPEAAQKELAQLGRLSAIPIGKFYLRVDRVEELRDGLTQAIDAFRQAQKVRTRGCGRRRCLSKCSR